MTVIINPFDAGGFTLAEMTEAINILPNRYSRITDLGLFRSEPITQTVVLVEYANGTINLLPATNRGGPAAVAKRDTGAVRGFAVPHIPYDDYILPGDFQGVRAQIYGEQSDPLAGIMNKRLIKMKAKHDLTREYMQINALRGILKSGSGATVYNFFTEFGVAQLDVDFVLGTAGTDVAAKCRQVLDYIEDNLNGEVMTEVRALVDRTFWGKLIGHAKVADAYKYFASAPNPLRDDLRRTGFEFAGITFEVYNGNATLSDGATSEPFLPAGEGVAFPIGTLDTFTTYDAPANLIETVNTEGLPFYARQYIRESGDAVVVHTESNPLPLNKRPRLTIRLRSSN
ncbi:hypothetical protein sos41_11820 [Alphaproteobacteria bacterium SO-S41]|nr:hypothetical protein sos41_11820 [Alphaproteobacteria bacterium SO-S41]